jgi:hypothetical protein
MTDDAVRTKVLEKLYPNKSMHIDDLRQAVDLDNAPESRATIRRVVDRLVADERVVVNTDTGGNVITLRP